MKNFAKRYSWEFVSDFITRIDDKTGGVGILVKEEQCENVVEVRRCDRVMAIGLVFEEEVVRV